jgi:hypothetical protein
MMKKLILVLLLSSTFSYAAYAQGNPKLAEGSSTKLSADERAKLRAELEAIHETDQQGRKAINASKSPEEKKALWDKQALIDTANQTRVEAIIKQHGWPGQTEFGAKASQAAFLVLQHAPLETMKRHFMTLQNAMNAGELNKESFALFDDRIRMYEERPQLYGSQVVRDEVSKKLMFYPIEDEANVDKRRAAMGLPPLAQYAKFFGFEYVPVAERTSSTSATNKPLTSDAKK